MSEKRKPQPKAVSQGHAQDDEPSTVNISEQKEYDLNRQSIMGRLFCWLGLHDDRVIDGTYGFGPGGNVERVECKRCRRMETRRAWSIKLAQN